MISMDDKDFTVKVTAKGLKTPTSLKGYWAFDVASGAVVGWAFGIKKDTNLFLACVRSMYRNLLDWGLGQPFEAQVENHLVSTFKDTMMKSGHLFPEVTFAGAENSQEKYAERNFHYFKHGVEKDNIVGVGRHYGRNRANRVRGKKVSDSTNENYEQNVYSYDKAEAVYTHLVHLYNDELHPDQKRYPGKTRLDVLKTCVHPTKIKPIDMMSLARWAGWSRDTSIVRGVIHADNEVYVVPHHYLDTLKQGSNKVTARWWRQSDEGSVEQMYLYQEDVYLGICEQVERYNSAKAEETEEDIQKRVKQSKRVAEWDKAISDRDVKGISFVKSESLKDIDLTPVQTVAIPLDDDAFEVDIDLEDLESQRGSHAQRAWADL